MLTISKRIPAGRGLAAALVRRAAAVVLDSDTRQKSRFDTDDSTGQRLGVFLPRGTAVRGGDVLVTEDGSKDRNFRRCFSALRLGCIGQRSESTAARSSGSEVAATVHRRGPCRQALPKRANVQSLAGSSERLSASMSGQLTLRLDFEHWLTNSCSEISSACNAFKRCRTSANLRSPMLTVVER